MNFMETMVMGKKRSGLSGGRRRLPFVQKEENEMVLRRAYLGKMVILGLRPEGFTGRNNRFRTSDLLRRESVEGIC